MQSVGSMPKRSKQEWVWSIFSKDGATAHCAREWLADYRRIFLYPCHARMKREFCGNPINVQLMNREYKKSAPFAQIAGVDAVLLTPNFREILSRIGSFDFVFGTVVNEEGESIPGLLTATTAKRIVPRGTCESIQIQCEKCHGLHYVAKPFGQSYILRAELPPPVRIAMTQSMRILVTDAQLNRLNDMISWQHLRKERIAVLDQPLDGLDHLTSEDLV
jgi:hypothetical protein